MKYLFKLVLIFSAIEAHSTRIIIHYESALSNRENSLFVERIFKNKFNIPQELIDRKNGDCTIKNKDRRFLHLCINKKGELLTLSSDIRFKIKSLSTFKLLQE